MHKEQKKQAIRFIARRSNFMLSTLLAEIFQRIHSIAELLRSCNKVLAYQEGSYVIKDYLFYLAEEILMFQDRQELRLLN